MNQQWHVVYTAPRAEKKAAWRLETEGYEVYLPLVTELRQWSDRKKKVQAPLFRSYLFVNTTPDRIPTVCGFPGVVCPVRYDGRFAVIRQKELDAIRHLLDTGLPIEVEPCNVAPGDRVVVESGSLSGLEGTCVDTAGQHFLYIEIPAISHVMKVKIPAGAVRKLAV